MIYTKTEREIEAMKAGGLLLAGIIKEVKESAKQGVSTEELDKLARELVLSYGAKPAFLGYGGFPAALCVSINDELVHGIPSKRLLKPWDMVSIDMGILYKGFYTDSAVSFLIRGDKSGIYDSDKVKSAEKLLSVTKEALNIGIKHARVGKRIGDIGSAIQEFVEKNGFAVARDLVGHGIGRELHEDPQVPNFGIKQSGPKLESGMTIAIEPMVIHGSHKVRLDSNGFTYKTEGGALCAHFEHTVAITEKGPEILTK